MSLTPNDIALLKSGISCFNASIFSLEFDSVFLRSGLTDPRTSLVNAFINSEFLISTGIFPCTNGTNASSTPASPARILVPPGLAFTTPPNSAFFCAASIAPAFFMR